MKTLLLILISFSCYSQITVKQARWCINNYDENFKLREVILVQDSLLQKDSLELVEYKKVVKKYQSDSTNYSKIIKNDSTIFTLKDNIIIAQSDQIQKTKRNSGIKTVVIIGLILGLIFK